MKRNMLQTTKMSRAKNKHLAEQGRGRNLNIFEHGIANFSGLGIRGKGLSHSKSDSSSSDIDEDTFILLALFAFMFYFFSTFFAGTSIYPTHNPTEYPSLNPSISKVPSLNPSEVPSVTPSPTGVSIIWSKAINSVNTDFNLEFT